MSNLWDPSPATSTDTTREFLVSVELYISNAAGTTLRKPLTDRKKTEKRGPLTYEEPKTKEKLNASGLVKNLNAAGHWRSATCKLLEEGDRCLLNVYVDESILYQTVYIHLLNQTDIRRTDTSLFYRKDCLGIFCIAGQRWTSSTVAEPLYLQFSNAETCSAWRALLQSYAIPEIYGRWFFPVDGGSYRMWRQLELTVIQGRNIGFTRPDAGTINVDSNQDNEGSDVDISCEIHLNDILCSRTTVKKGLGAPDWHESFTFPGLPPFENLDIVVWKEKKLSKPTCIGTTCISLANFRRGDIVEGWFPVVQPGPTESEIQLGELRLKIQVDEEIILPYSSYAKLMQTCNSRSYIEWMADLENCLKLKNISPQLMAVAVATNRVIKQIQEYASKEVEKSALTAHHTLFRGNTTLTKTIELCMTWYGRSFLDASIGGVLRKLCTEKVAIEVDPLRITKGSKYLERGVELLLYWCQEFWNQIHSVRGECPNEMRLLFNTIRKIVEQRYRPDPISIDNQGYLPLQSVSAFCFLRFIVPAILHPHLFGLCPGLPGPAVQRSLTLIAKVIQSLANLNTNTPKESFMACAQGFLKDSLPAMIDYIHVVSTPADEMFPPTIRSEQMDRHERLTIVNSLRQRKKNMTPLDREAVLNLPHLVDVPRHLASITSAIIRNYRDLSSRPRTGDDTDLAVDEFCCRCFEIEEEALCRVRQLASKLASESGKRKSMQGTKVSGPMMSEPPDKQLPRSPIPEVMGSVILGPPSHHRKRSLRPATAPSPTATNWSHQQSLPGKDKLGSQGNFVVPFRDGNQPWDGRHALHHKSPSIDSFSPRVNHDEAMPIRSSHLVEAQMLDSGDDHRRKKGLLRNILSRR